MSKSRDGENGGKNWRQIMVEIVATYVVAS